MKEYEKKNAVYCIHNIYATHNHQLIVIDTFILVVCSDFVFFFCVSFSFVLVLVHCVYSAIYKSAAMIDDF